MNPKQIIYIVKSNDIRLNACFLGILLMNNFVPTIDNNAISYD